MSEKLEATFKNGEVYKGWRLWSALSRDNDTGQTFAEMGDDYLMTHGVPCSKHAYSIRGGVNIHFTTRDEAKSVIDRITRDSKPSPFTPEQEARIFEILEQNQLLEPT